MGAATANPNKDSMKSTWREDPERKGWRHHHYLIEWLGLQPTNLNEEVPVHEKTDKMPYFPHWKAHVWIILTAGWPLVLHQLYFNYFGQGPHILGALVFYSIAFKINAISEIHMLRRLGHRYGFLDGDKHARDQVPDNSVGKTLQSLSLTSTIRPLLALILVYNRKLAPSSMSWWTPVEIGLYGIVLDFYFYWYHRAMHCTESLWKFHRTHHLTKHPNPLMSIYADTEQEIFDIAVVPFLTWATLRLMGFPMGFFESWLCHQYIVFVELFGHSGVRVFLTVPSPNTPFLRFFNAELCTEDHDMHHRRGWKKSQNYGKQTLLWDRIFGTAGERVEMKEEMIDHSQHAIIFR